MIITGNSAPLRGEITVPGDKSISHRAVMLGALAEGTTEITHFLRGADCLSTIRIFRALGVEIEERPDVILVHGKGLRGLIAPSGVLDTGNSGTTLRLVSGILSGLPFESTLTGDASIRRRPMKRIMVPLSRMGARIESVEGSGCAPLRICGGNLHGIAYTTPVASAQVKSAILLAGLYAEGETSVTENAKSRDHTERMLQSFGADIHVEGNTVTLRPGNPLTGLSIDVPGDISSAAYFIAAATLVPGSEVLIRGVGINPTRAGMLEVCSRMGADITALNVREAGGETSADLLVRHAQLKGTEIGGDLIPALIDEIPVLAVMAAFAEGTTVIKDASELRVKESDRIRTVTENLRAMGGEVTPTDDGMIIEGTGFLSGSAVNAHMDHRIAMSFAVAALASKRRTNLQDAQCVGISYPDFYKDLFGLIQR